MANPEIIRQIDKYTIGQNDVKVKRRIASLIGVPIAILMVFAILMVSYIYSSCSFKNSFKSSGICIFFLVVASRVTCIVLAVPTKLLSFLKIL
jgi:hypothetical protein